MTPEAKIWLILKNLNDALAIVPSGNLALLNAKDLEKLMAREDHEQILGKLVKDYKVVDIQKKPDYKKGFFYKFKITDSDEFNKILKNAHIKHFGSLGMLTGDNFLSVVDVAEDIMNGLQMIVKDKITIPIIPSTIRFPTLLSAKSPNLIDRYWKLRWNALEYLANNKAIIKAELHRNEIYPSGSPVEVNLDRIKFTKFYEKLLKVYNKRVKFDDGKKNSRNMQDNLDYADTSSRKAWEKKWEVIKAVQVASDHRLIRDQWLNIKRILDAIYKQLSPLIKGQQIISLNPDTLPAEQKRLFSSVLEDMLKAGVADYFKVESKILADSISIRRFLNGESIIIKDINNFEEYRKKITELYNFIEQDGQKRFPKAYQSSVAREREKYLYSQELQRRVEEAQKEKRLAERISQNITEIQEIKEHQKMVTKREPIEIKIIGETEIKGLEKGLKAIAQTKTENKNKFPYKLPAGTKWENFIIKFEDDENVFIQIKQFKHNAYYEEMGMVGRGKNPNPSEAWMFMKVLAQVNGELTIKDAQARDKYKKQKELLAKALQKYFSLDYDPFYPYHSSTEKRGNSYKIKITLIPPPDKKEKADTDKDDDDDLGIKEYFNEQAPQVYEDP